MEVEAASGSAGEIRWSKLGTSLPVANVQALVASAVELTVDQIEWYIQPDIEAHAVLPEHSGEVPVIDLSNLLSPESVEAEAAKLRFACAEWGFFQVVNHGIPDEVITGIKHDIQKFFQLPLEVKNAYAQRPRDLQGYGQAFVVSDDQKLDWFDLLALFAQPIQARDMSYWPSQPHTFRNSVEEYSLEVMKLTHSLNVFIAKTLDVAPELLADKHVAQFLRMSYYPPCTSMPEKVLGFSPHSDGSFLTILLEINSVQGLQIRRSGAWIPVKPRHDALLVNVGDLLEWYRAPQQRKKLQPGPWGTNPPLEPTRAAGAPPLPLPDYARTGSLQPRPERTSMLEREEGRSSLHHAGNNTPPRSTESSCTGDENHRRPPPAPHRSTPSTPTARTGASLPWRRRRRGTKSLEAGRRLRIDDHTWKTSAHRTDGSGSRQRWSRRST